MPRLPVQAQVELTKRCNFGCDHCFASATPDDARHMSSDVLRRALGELEDAGVYWVQLTGGEPLLAEHFHEAVSLALGGPTPQQVSVLSNGSLWTPGDVDEVVALSRSNPARQLTLQFSIDGHDEASFAAARSVEPGTFERVCDNIRRVAAAGLATGGLLVVTSRTVGHALRTARFAMEELGVGTFALAPLYVSGRAHRHYTDLAFEFQAWSDTLLEASRIKQGGLWGDMSGRLTVNIYTVFELVLPLEGTDYLAGVWEFDEKTLGASRPVFCEAGYTDVFVAHDGRVFPCPPASDVEDFVAGDLTRDSLRDIWANSPLLNWFRGVHERVARQEPCASCRYAKICGGGCRIASLLQLGDMERPDPRCPIVKEWMVRHNGP